MRVKLYIKDKEGEYVNIPLFADESINYQSKLSDVEDLDVVFNDSTNSFTIPATDATNEVFNYWFELGIDDATTGDEIVFDIKQRLEAYIEINTIPFKEGKVSLINIVYKDGLPLFYTIEFYGSLVKLNDSFLEDKLNELEYLSNYDYTYSVDNLLKTINRPDELFTDIDVVTPFILNTDRNITVGGPDEGNITTNEGAIKQEELRPGIKVRTIIDAIASKYDLDIQSDFFNRQEFERLYLWLNEKDEFSSVFSWDTLEVKTATHSPLLYGLEIEDNILTFDNRREFFIETNLTNTPSFFWTNTVEVLVITEGLADAVNSLRFRLVNVDTNEVVDQVDYTSSNWNQSGNTLRVGLYERKDFKHLNMPISNISRLKVEVSTSSPITVTTYLEIEMSYNSRSIRPPRYRRVFTYETLTIYNLYLSSKLGILTNIPDMTIGEFFKGIMDIFRLVIIPTGADSFLIEPLEYYYSIGDTLDITPFVDKNSYNATRRNTYRRLDFKWDDYSGVLQEHFKREYDREYGDLEIFNRDLDGDRVIKLPFINLMVSDLSLFVDDENIGEVVSIIPVALMQDLDGDTIKSNNNGNVLFYYRGTKNLNTVLVKLEIAGTVEGIQYIADFGLTDDYSSSQVTNQLTWGKENVGIINPKEDKSLYNNWWKNWVDILYHKDSRILTLEGYLDYPTIDRLLLNTNVIYKGDSYYINDYDVNLLNGHFKMSLFPNFRVDGVGGDIISNNRVVYSCNAGKQYCTVDLKLGGRWGVSKNYLEGVGWVKPVDEPIPNFQSSLVIQEFTEGRYYNFIVESNAELVYQPGSDEGYNSSRRCVITFTNQDTQEEFELWVVQDGLNMRD